VFLFKEKINFLKNYFLKNYNISIKNKNELNNTNYMNYFQLNLN